MIQTSLIFLFLGFFNFRPAFCELTLPPSTRRLSLRHGKGVATVYLCGTAHVSTRSCEEVSTLINSARPEVVVVELCSQRLSMLKNSTSEQPPVTLKSSFQAFRRGETGILEALLMWMQSQSARVLKV